MIKVYIKYHNKDIDKIESHGCWIDLRSSENYNFPKGTNKLIDLNISMKLPKYYEANIVPRSSTYKNYGVIQLNHIGIIDDTYCGNNDRWMLNAYALDKDCEIHANDRVCQFNIKPSMFAPWYVKLKWLFNNGVKFIEVDDLKSVDRGGFGTSGKQ